MYKSVTDVNWSKGLGSLFSYVNEVTNGVISQMFIFAIFCIFLTGVYYSTKNFKMAMVVASLVSLIISIFFIMIQFVNIYTFMIVLAVFIVSVVYAFFPSE